MQVPAFNLNQWYEREEARRRREGYLPELPPIAGQPQAPPSAQETLPMLGTDPFGGGLSLLGQAVGRASQARQAGPAGPTPFYGPFPANQAPPPPPPQAGIDYNRPLIGQDTRPQFQPNPQVLERIRRSSPALGVLLDALRYPAEPLTPEPSPQLDVRPPSPSPAMRQYYEQAQGIIADRERHRSQPTAEFFDLQPGAVDFDPNTTLPQSESGEYPDLAYTLPTPPERGQDVGLPMLAEQTTAAREREQPILAELRRAAESRYAPRGWWDNFRNTMTSLHGEPGVVDRDRAEGYALAQEIARLQREGYNLEDAEVVARANVARNVQQTTEGNADRTWDVDTQNSTRAEEAHRQDEQVAQGREDDTTRLRLDLEAQMADVGRLGESTQNEMLGRLSEDPSYGPQASEVLGSRAGLPGVGQRIGANFTSGQEREAFFRYYESLDERPSEQRALLRQIDPDFEKRTGSYGGRERALYELVRSSQFAQWVRRNPWLRDTGRGAPPAPNGPPAP